MAWKLCIIMQENSIVIIYFPLYIYVFCFTLVSRCEIAVPTQFNENLHCWWQSVYWIYSNWKFIFRPLLWYRYMYMCLLIKSFEIKLLWYSCWNVFCTPALKKKQVYCFSSVGSSEPNFFVIFFLRNNWWSRSLLCSLS